MKIAFFVFDGITPLDVIGPYQVLARLPGAESIFVGLAKGVVRSDDGIDDPAPPLDMKRTPAHVVDAVRARIRAREAALEG